jgi:3-deoxy-D-manno-octulosonate 8-phosphate phosphatase (KDO 8-P phosphatase)
MDINIIQFPGSIMKKSDLERQSKQIKLIILDVDGVMTDGRIILDNNGNELKAFHVRDGHGIKMAIKAGLRIAIITGRQSRIVEIRAEELGIQDVYQGVKDKRMAYENLLGKYGLKDEEVAFMGDDIVDIPLMKRVGLAAAPIDADELTAREADFVSNKRGGVGAVRDFIEFVLKASGKWTSLIEGNIA